MPEETRTMSRQPDLFDRKSPKPAAKPRQKRPFVRRTMPDRPTVAALRAMARNRRNGVFA